MCRIDRSDFLAQIFFYNGHELGEQNVWRRVTSWLLVVVPRQASRHLEFQTLTAMALAEGVEIHPFKTSRTDQRRPPTIVRERRFHFHLRWNIRRIDVERSDVIPIHLHPVPDALRITFHPRKPNFQVRLFRNRPNTPNTRGRLRNIARWVFL